MQTAEQALARAEALVNKAFTLTGEVKLLPLAMNELEKCWDCINKERTIPAEFQKTYKEIKELQKAKKTSAIEFKRKERLIVCSDAYKINAFEGKKIEKYIKTTKTLLNGIKTHA
ncbi:hypothetical protein HZA98_02510 [Candidatus Woesearchaeota archaeon]|nr:hypothetical protein [Candidatus Woesearchaeota archaeon]